MSDIKFSSDLKWHLRFIELAQQISTWSKDRSTKVGAVVVRDRRIQTTGYNGFPVGINDNLDARHERPAKYSYVAHAEANCIFQAARDGISLKDCTLYLNYEGPPCCECTKATIQAGITDIVSSNTPFPGKGTQWEYSLGVSREMLHEARVGMWRTVVKDVGLGETVGHLEKWQQDSGMWEY